MYCHVAVHVSWSGFYVYFAIEYMSAYLLVMPIDSGYMVVMLIGFVIILVLGVHFANRCSTVVSTLHCVFGAS